MEQTDSRCHHRHTECIGRWFRNIRLHVRKKSELGAMSPLLFVRVMKMNYPKIVQYLMAVALIVSSIVMAFYQILDIDDVANGTLMYIAQAFLLAGSIFGLDYYVKKLSYEIDKKGTKRNQEQ